MHIRTASLSALAVSVVLAVSGCSLDTLRGDAGEAKKDASVSLGADGVKVGDGEGNGASLGPDGVKVGDGEGNGASLGPDGVKVGDGEGAGADVSIGPDGVKVGDGADSVASGPRPRSAVELSCSDGAALITQVNAEVDLPDCAVVKVSAANAQVTAGVIGTLTVTGTNNEVHARSVSSVSVSGANNKVTWRTGRPSVVQNQGVNNELHSR